MARLRAYSTTSWFLVAQSSTPIDGCSCGFLHVAVECLQIELQLAQVLGLELDDLQFEGDQAVERPVEEEQVEHEVPPADLDRVLAADEAEVAAELDQELLELLDQGPLQVGLGMRWAEGQGTRPDRCP